MKKITLTLITVFFANTFFGQTFSTGTIVFPSPLSEYSVKIDVTSTLVTLTQIMPSDRWYSLAFDNGNSMSAIPNGGDIIAFINTANISDRQLGGFQVPAADAVQSWTTTSNTITGTTRTVISTRALNTGEPSDYVFSATAGSINLACSRSASASFTLQAHGGLSNAVSTAAYAVTLGNNEFEKQSFKLFPNPAKGFATIQMPDITTSGELKMYDALGRVVKKQTISEISTQVNISDLLTGTYLIVIRTDYGNSTKQLVIE